MGTDIAEKWAIDFMDAVLGTEHGARVSTGNAQHLLAILVKAQKTSSKYAGLRFHIVDGDNSNLYAMFSNQLEFINPTLLPGMKNVREPDAKAERTDQDHTLDGRRIPTVEDIVSSEGSDN